ncbi:MAG: peptide deformylase [Clostridia bacterium]|nr:peptide deformylase [Clostridia bacterium]
MIRPIMRTIEFLKQPSETATKDDLGIAQDLLDTLKAHKDECVGMAANMIGETKRIIAFIDGGKYTVMFNPRILKADVAFKAEEGCLSLVGVREAKRYRSVKVEFENENFQRRIKTYKGWTAQIIQHEMDHLEGVII